MGRRKKKELSKLSKKIKRLVEKHGQVRLEVYSKDYGYRKYTRPYGMRHLYKNGNCTIRYWDSYRGFKGRKRQSSCFMDDYSVYRNCDGDKIVKLSLTDTLRAMERHDRSYHKVKYIYAGKKKYEV